MTNELTPERIWIDQYGQRLYDDHPRKLEGTGYVRDYLLATVRAEERKAALKDAIDIFLTCSAEGASTERTVAALEAAGE